MNAAALVATRAAGKQRMAGDRLQGLLDWWDKLPEFVREDLPEGLLVGALTAAPVALQPNQDPHEQAAALAGGIGLGILGGAGARHLGAAIGRRVHSGEFEPGTFWANFGSTAGRPSTLAMAREYVNEGSLKPMAVTGQEVGRGLGRVLGDEVSALAGTGGALALAQQMDTTPDPVPQPDAVGSLTHALPGVALSAGLGLAGSGLVDVGGTLRDLQPGSGVDPWEAVRRNSVFRRRL